MELLDTVRKRIKMIEDFKQEIKVAKEALKDELDNDEPYTEAAAAVKEANQKKKQLKDQLMSRPGNQKLLDDIRVNNEEITTLLEILSAELMEIYQETNSDQIIGEDGTPVKFKIVAKLLPKKGEFEDRD